MRIPQFVAGLALVLSVASAAQQVDLGPGSVVARVQSLKAGQYVWVPDIAPKGPLLLLVNLKAQRATLYRNGVPIGASTVSTGRPGYSTPTGSFKPIRMHKMWYSSKYENAPMPYAIFFHGGYAIHGTTDVAHLGQIASHGCVRLHPDNAELLFDLVNKVGMKNTRISLIRS